MCWVEFRWNFYDWTWNTAARFFQKIHFHYRQVWIFIFARQTEWRQKNRICPERTKLRPGASVLAAPFTLNWYQIGKQLPTWKEMRAKRAEKKSHCWPKLLDRSTRVLCLFLDHFKNDSRSKILISFSLLELYYYPMCKSSHSGPVKYALQTAERGNHMHFSSLDMNVSTLLDQISTPLNQHRNYIVSATLRPSLTAISHWKHRFSSDHRS
jgi:hypothetical protein